MESKIKIVLLTVLTLSVLTIAIILMTGISRYSIGWWRDRREGEVSLYDRGNNRSYRGEIYPEQTKNRDDIVREMPKTTMQFYETWVNAGIVSRGQVVRHTFRFKNTGEHPLMIAKADVTCGCTAPRFPEDAIAPGQEGEITVEVNTGVIDSSVYSHESPVTVHANTIPEAVTIKLYVEITNRNGQ